MIIVLITFKKHLIQVGEALFKMVWSFGAIRLGDQLTWYQLQRLNSVSVMASSTLIAMMMVVVAWLVIRKKSFAWYKSVIESNGAALYR